MDYPCPVHRQKPSATYHATRGWEPQATDFNKEKQYTNIICTCTVRGRSQLTGLHLGGWCGAQPPCQMFSPLEILVTISLAYILAFCPLIPRNEILNVAQQHEPEQQVLYYGLPVPSAPSETIGDSSRHPEGGSLRQPTSTRRNNIR